MGKLTISMAMFNSYVSHYQRAIIFASEAEGSNWVCLENLGAPNQISVENMIYSNWLEWNGLIYVQTNPKKSSVEKPNGGG